MTKKEFIKKYCSPVKFEACKQVVWDLCSDIEDTFENTDIDIMTALGSVHYSINILLEVVREDLPDYEYLKNMIADIELMQEEYAD